MGFNSGDMVTVQGLEPGIGAGRICDGDSGVVVEGPGSNGMYGVEFGIPQRLYFHAGELVLTADLRPPTSWVPVIGERVVSLEDPEHVEGVVIATSGEACAVRFDDYDSEVWCNYDELGRLESPTSRSPQVGDRVAQAAFGHCYDGIPPEATGVVVEGEDDMCIEVQWDGMGWSLPMKKSEIELIEKHREEKVVDPFQISDVVVIQGTGTSLDGSVAQVHGVQKGACDVLVIGSPTNFVIDNTELELLAHKQDVEATTR